MGEEKQKKSRLFELADGITHELFLRKGWYAVIPIGAILLFSTFNFLWPVLLYFNFLICDFLDPDADQLGWTKSEGDLMRTLRRFKLGLLGILWVNHWMIYAEIIRGLGGHRSWASHGWVIGTVGRMIWFNIPIAGFFYGFYLYGLSKWNLLTFDVIGWRYFHMDVWLIPYLVTQLISWLIGDGIHLVLDTEWFKKISKELEIASGHKKKTR